MGHILKMKPVFKEMIWGGHKLKDVYGYDIPSSSTGEAWVLSAHKNGDCEVESGEFKGKKLSELWNTHRELFGNIEGKEFPLLVKYIDANADLSVQVHPDNDYAAKNENSLGKTESWYVLDCDDDTKMVMGHHAKTKDELIKDIKTNDYDHLLNSFKINKGDFFYIPSGTIHAICAGSLIYEAQQSSDITYRVYDYDRKDANGNTRELHVDKSIDVIRVPFDNQTSSLFNNQHLDHGSVTHYLKAEYFCVDCYRLEGENIIINDSPFLMLSVIEGEGTMNGEEIKKGDNFIICSDEEQLDIDGWMTLMVTHL